MECSLHSGVYVGKTDTQRLRCKRARVRYRRAARRGRTAQTQLFLRENADLAPVELVFGNTFASRKTSSAEARGRLIFLAASARYQETDSSINRLIVFRLIS
jgi:hypothetical protein